MVDADFNGDGYVDLAVRTQYPIGIVVLHNDAGSLQVTGGITIDETTGGLASGDIDGDGDFDILVANNATGDVQVFLNDGEGGFTDSFRVSTQPYPSHVAVGDLTNDGLLELIVGYSNRYEVGVYENLGGGAFGPESVYFAWNRHKSISLGDLDADGWLDLVVVSSRVGRADVLLSNGDGTFAETVSYYTSSSAVEGELADVDADGDLDLFVTNANENDLRLYLNDGTGSFGPQIFDSAINIPTSPYPTSQAIADFDADGDADLAVVCWGGENDVVDVLRNPCVLGPCSFADIAPPAGVLDIDDLALFIGRLLLGEPTADVAVPFGVLDLADAVAFVTAFGNGCP